MSHGRKKRSTDELEGESKEETLSAIIRVYAKGEENAEAQNATANG